MGEGLRRGRFGGAIGTMAIGTLAVFLAGTVYAQESAGLSLEAAVRRAVATTLAGQKVRRMPGNSTPAPSAAARAIAFGVPARRLVLGGEPHFLCVAAAPWCNRRGIRRSRPMATALRAAKACVLQSGVVPAGTPTARRSLAHTATPYTSVFAPP